MKEKSMELSRRDLGFLLPLLAAANGGAQERQPGTLGSKVYHHGQIAYEGDQKKKGRRFFYGKAHGGFKLEMHETALGEGTQTHAPHKHEHEEIVILVEGTVETYMDGKTEIAEAGSVIYLGSNQMHSVRNTGTGPCRYYVIELRGNEA
jgi:quercetin dioxygenase-like cupin family protein